MDRSANMRAIRSKDMKPEIAVRGLVYRLGYRFRLPSVPTWVRHFFPTKLD